MESVKDEKRDMPLNGEHVLVCLSSAPSNARIIRTAADMAKAYGARFTALFVETQNLEKASPENKSRLQANMELATELGAEIETVFGDDIAYQIARFSEEAGITKLVIGRSTFTKNRLLRKSNLVESLLAYAPEVEIHIIPDRSADIRYVPKRSHGGWREILENFAISFAILGGATAICYLFQWLGFADANMIMVYILGVLVTSVATLSIAFSMISSLAGVLLFNFLFIAPKFSLAANGTGYPMTFLIMFLTAFLSGLLAQRYKQQANVSHKIARRLRLLFDTNKLLFAQTDRDKIISLTAEQLIKLFKSDVLIFDGDMNAAYFPENPSATAIYDVDLEKKRAEMAMSGVTSKYEDDEAKFFYLPLRVNDKLYGAVGIDGAGLSAFDRDTFSSVALECALALDNEYNRREKEQATIVASNEQLRANILRSISHDLRTPLTSISGNAANLLENGEKFDAETRKQLLSDILSDSDWLINLTENLLASTRMEDGKLGLRLADELIDDIVDTAVGYCKKRANGHFITLKSCDKLMFVSVDAKLIVQVIVNLIDNAVKYTPEGSHITVSIEDALENVRVSVMDDGGGISEEDKPHIFDKFFSGASKLSDSRRSLGLGLYLCKAIIEAHGGEIRLKDNAPHGSIFEFELKKKEITINE